VEHSNSKRLKNVPSQRIATVYIEENKYYPGNLFYESRSNTAEPISLKACKLHFYLTINISLTTFPFMISLLIKTNDFVTPINLK